MASAIQKFVLLPLALFLTFVVGAAVGVLIDEEGTGALAATPEQDAQGRYVVSITSGHEFSPATALVPKGATVLWRNEGSTPHDVTAQSDAWSSDDVGGKLREGDAFERVFAEAGAYRYECELHSNYMKGIVIVEA